MTTWAEITTAIGLVLADDKEAAFRQLTRCWEQTGANDHGQRCVIAHHLSDLQPTPAEPVAWHERALREYADVGPTELAEIGIPDARGLAPSLHLNLGEAYLCQGRIDEAELQRGLGLAAEDALADDRFGAMVRGGLLRLGERIAEARKPQAN